LRKFSILSNSGNERSQVIISYSARLLLARQTLWCSDAFEESLFSIKMMAYLGISSCITACRKYLPLSNSCFAADFGFLFSLKRSNYCSSALTATRTTTPCWFLTQSGALCRLVIQATRSSCSIQWSLFNLFIKH